MEMNLFNKDTDQAMSEQAITQRALAVQAILSMCMAEAPTSTEVNARPKGDAIFTNPTPQERLRAEACYTFWDDGSTECDRLGRTLGLGEYIAGGENRVELTPAFRQALDTNQPLVVDGQVIWEPGTPLPDYSPVFYGGGMGLFELFKDLTGVVHLDLSEFCTVGITSLGSLCEGCTSLETLILPKGLYSSVYDLGDMCKGCTSLTKLDLSGCTFINVNVSEIFVMGMCDGCTSLEVVDFRGTKFTCAYNRDTLEPSPSLEVGETLIVSNAFRGCDLLEDEVDFTNCIHF